METESVCVNSITRYKIQCLLMYFALYYIVLQTLSVNLLKFKIKFNFFGKNTVQYFIV